MQVWATQLLTAYPSKIILLALLYIATGKLGLFLAVPPGYATVIWPPSGIALGMLLVHGWRLWPGILLGSFTLNCLISGAFENEIELVKILSALLIAIGSTLQALAGRWLLHRLIGLPLSFNRLREIFYSLLLACPITCLVAASIGISSLLVTGSLSGNEMSANWLTWWIGDMLGVLLFLPLVLIMPNKQSMLKWRGHDLGVLPVLAMLALIIPLGMTFYAWKISSENIYEQSLSDFKTLSVESEKALLYKMDSYGSALLGWGGLFSGSKHVSRLEWKTYVETINLNGSFPGMNGIGYIVSLKSDELDRFVQEMRADEAPDFIIHPDTVDRPYYVIAYLNPVANNKAAEGLNIGFEENRTIAAELARDTGKPAITKHIVLVQDEQKSPGFLLFHPMYKSDMPVNTVAEKRAAFRGWIYAPFIASNFLTDLTQSQGKTLNIRIYDGTSENSESLIYSSNDSINDKHKPSFIVRKELDVMQRKWLVVWESTLSYEHTMQREAPLFILVGGILFTGIFGVFLMIVSIRNTDAQWITEERKSALPLLIFAVFSVGSYYLFDVLKKQEVKYIQSTIEEESRKIEQIISIQAHDKLMALKRMSQRWVSAGKTPYDQWQDDAKNYIEQLDGLKAVEWVDSTYHVAWVEPIKGNEMVAGLNVLFDKKREGALKGAAARKALTVTPPLDLIQGYKGFIVYAPIEVNGTFDGFMAGIFSIDELLGSVLKDEVADKYIIHLLYEGEEFYCNEPDHELIPEKWAIEKKIRIYDREWSIKISPHEEFLQGQLSALPVIVFAAGLLISALLGLIVRYILIARVKSGKLTEANILREAILTSAKYILIATDQNGVILLINDYAEKMLEEERENIVGRILPRRWLKDREFMARAEQLEKELKEDVGLNFDVFSKKAMRFGIDMHEWTFVSKSGKEFPVNLTVTTLRDDHGKITGFLGVAEDISERKQQQKALQTSEETFRSAMEYSSVGMALVDLDGKWIRVNPALCQIVGYTPEEIENINLYSLTHQDDMESQVQNTYRILKGELKTYQAEQRYICKDGRIAWVNLSMSLARKTDGSSKYFVIQVQDITERKEMDRLKSEFISVVSHELRTPLTSIRGSLGLIEGAMSNDISEKVRNLIGIAHKNCERLILLINDILDLDKIAAGKMHFDMKEENVSELVRSGIEVNSSYAEKFKIRFIVQNLPTDSSVRVDADRWQQIFSNLLSNAAKFSPEGSNVVIFAQLIKDKVRISIRDQGPGISEEFRARIFSKFSQSASALTRSKGGTGLGLNISKEMVMHMGGEIGFDSQEGKGSTFWFEFPAINSRAYVDEDQEDAHIPDLLHILHIEDDPDFNQILTMALKGKARLVAARTLKEAKDLIQKKDFSLVLLDIGMPDGSGLSILEELPSDAKPLPPVIIISASEVSPDIEQKVAAAMVKSRVSEEKIINTILFYLKPQQGKSA